MEVDVGNRGSEQPKERATELWNKVPVPERVAERAFLRRDENESGCWISRYSVSTHGYAQIGWSDGTKTNMVLAHRAAAPLACGLLQHL